MAFLKKIPGIRLLARVVRDLGIPCDPDNSFRDELCRKRKYLEEKRKLHIYMLTGPNRQSMYRFMWEDGLHRTEEKLLNVEKQLRRYKRPLVTLTG